MYQSIIPTAVIVASLFTAAGYAAQEYTVVTGVASDDVLNVRDAPNARANIVGRLPHDANRVAVGRCTSNGTPMTAAEWASQATSGDRTVSTWCSVEHASLPTKPLGWVNSRFLHPTSSSRVEVEPRPSSTVGEPVDLSNPLPAEPVFTSRQNTAQQNSMPRPQPRTRVTSTHFAEFMNHTIPLARDLADYEINCCWAVNTRSPVYVNYSNTAYQIGYTIYSRHSIQILECRNNEDDIINRHDSDNGRCLIRDNLSDEASAIGWVDIRDITSWRSSRAFDPFLLQTVEHFQQGIAENRAQEENYNRRASSAQPANESRRSSSRYPRSETALLTQCFLSAYSNVLASPMGTAYSRDSGPEAGRHIYRSIVSGAANMRRAAPDELRRLNDNERAYYRQHVNTYRRRGTSIAGRHREVIFVYNGAFSDFIDDLVRDCNAPP